MKNMIALMIFFLNIFFFACARNTDSNIVLQRTMDDNPSVNITDYEILNGEPFLFIMGEGNALYGFDTLYIENRKCTYIFKNILSGPKKNIWLKSEFELAETVIKDLRKLILNNEYFILKKMYSSGIPDGLKWFFKVKIGTKKKGVYCDTYFPKPIEKISKFVHNKILNKNTLILKNVEKIDYKIEDWEPVTW